MAAVETGLSVDYLKAIMGTWVMDSGRSRFSSTTVPQSITRKYEPEGNGYKLTFEQVTAEGVQDAWEYTAEYDGKDYPVSGTDEVDTIALSQVDELTTLGIFKKDGQEVALYKRGQDRDGQTMTITTAGVNADGDAYYDVTVYRKQ